jgi:hypothetical protein
MEKHARNLRLPDLRNSARGGRRRGDGDEGRRATMADQDRDRLPRAWPHRDGARLGEGVQIPPRREPRALAGHLDQLLPAKSKVRKVKHHPALPYDEIRDFVKDLQSRVGVAAAALEFLLWTAGRTDEVIRAR